MHILDCFDKLYFFAIIGYCMSGNCSFVYLKFKVQHKKTDSYLKPLYMSVDCILVMFCCGSIALFILRS